MAPLSSLFRMCDDDDADDDDEDDFDCRGWRPVSEISPPTLGPNLDLDVIAVKYIVHGDKSS